MPLQCSKCKTRHWNRTHGGWVYLAQAVNPHANSLTKIGWSSQPHVRMTALRDPEGQKVQMILAMPCNTREAEPMLHVLFGKYRVVGEWFALTPELIEKVKQVDLFDIPTERIGGGYPMQWLKGRPTDYDQAGNPIVTMMEPKSLDEIIAMHRKPELTVVRDEYSQE